MKIFYFHERPRRWPNVAPLSLGEWRPPSEWREQHGDYAAAFDRGPVEIGDKSQLWQFRHRHGPLSRALIGESKNLHEVFGRSGWTSFFGGRWAVRTGAKAVLFVAILAMSALPNIAMASTSSSALLREAGSALDRGEFAAALQLIQPLADQGEPLAEYALGGMYAYGFGVTRSYPEAVKWLRTAAGKGIAPAQYELGYMYENGQGVTQDFAEAARWYRMAAEQGDDSSEVNLGYLYESGKGVARDLVQAYKWYHLAATAKDNPVAQSCLLIRDALAARMTAKQIEEAKRLATMVQPK
jgi:hypothetical protein